MYADEATKKDNYYSAYVQSKFEKGVMECRAKTMKQLVICITIAALIIILMLVLSYRQYRAKAKMKMEVEKKDHEMKEQLHKEMLRHKEVQISMMRDFILQKVNTAQKIEEIKNNQGENISLTTQRLRKTLSYSRASQNSDESSVIHLWYQREVCPPEVICL